jgi:release factor glutamine methyltransferase
LLSRSALRSDSIADSLADSIAGIADRLRSAGCVFAEEEARLLVEAAPCPANVAAAVERRIAGYPLEQILGWAEFAGLRIELDSGVFVPRRRTELLVNEAVAALAKVQPKESPLLRARLHEGTKADDGARVHEDPVPEPVRSVSAAVVVDLCCGSGAAGTAIASRVAGLELYAADIDPAAVACARRNVARVGGEVLQGDLFDALPSAIKGQVSVLTANAPYVPTAEIATMPREARDYEPTLSLDGGADGLDLHRRVAAGAGEWLHPGGYLLIETSERQAGHTASIMASAGFKVRTVRSDELDGTVVVGRAR